MAVFWITEALPIAVTSLLPIILTPMVGLASAKTVSKQYLNVSNKAIPSLLHVHCMSVSYDTMVVEFK